MSPLSPGCSNSDHTLLSDVQLARLESLNHPRKRSEYIHSRQLIRYALSDCFPDHSPTFWNIQEHPENAPVVSNLPRHYYTSLTHTGPIAGFALSKKPVGIDIEDNLKHRTFVSLAATFTDKRDFKWLESSTDLKRDFYRLWCAKEAWYKALPRDTQRRTKLSSLSYQALADQTSEYALLERALDGFQLSVVAQASSLRLIVSRLTLANDRKFVVEEAIPDCA